MSSVDPKVKERYEDLNKIVTDFAIQRNVPAHEMNIHLLNIMGGIISTNIQRAIAQPSFAFNTVESHKLIKEALNKLTFTIDSKRNVLRSLAKEYRKRFG